MNPTTSPTPTSLQDTQNQETSLRSAPCPPPLFRKVDWLTFLVTFAVVWMGYYLTLAPELTLEDSGELATGSFYAGIPHPPGYPVWTIYTWLWTVLLPIKNVAWRVALGEATGGAFAAGLLGLLVSRGSSFLMESIEERKGIARRDENAICIVAGFVAGLLLGFNGFMWSQSVIVEVYSFGVASLMVVLLFLLRWLYAPHQLRYLYLALFFHGICFTNHQTLIVAALGIEALIAAADFRMGRYLFLGNGIVYLMGLILKQHHVLTALEHNLAIFVLFNVVGCCSIALYVWFSFLSKETLREFCLDASLAGFFVLLSLIPTLGVFGLLLAVVALGCLIKFARDTHRLGWEWLVVILCGCCWLLGASFYFYMPLAGMTNPPMEWGYPRTVDGFVRAFTRGQYEQAHPTDLIHHPGVFAAQLVNLGRGIVDEFNWAYVFLALVPFAFYRKMQKRERAWLIGLTSIYLCLGVLLLILLNPPPDRAAQQLNRVFFTASHTVIALLVGYGLALVAAYMATHYERFRHWGLTGGAVALALAALSFAQIIEETYFGDGTDVSFSQLLSFVGTAFTNKDQYALPIDAGLLLLGLAALFLGAIWRYRDRAPLTLTLGLFALMPLHSILTHWSDNEQRNHWFGYWFGHDMFTPPFHGAGQQPLYPEMPRNAVIFGGTDPGRFCPTYMIFCDSFVPPRCRPAQDQQFDRRDVYLITQNALADPTYLEYVRAQYNRSAQIDPPFFQELVLSEQARREHQTNWLARAVTPLDRFFTQLGARIEKRRRTYTSWFQASDFVDLPALAARLRPGPQQEAFSKYVYEHLSPETQKLLQANTAAQSLPTSLVTDLNALLDREKHLAEHLPTPQLSDYLRDFIKENPQGDTRVRLNRLLFEAAYSKEIARSLGGVYPDREIYIASPNDLTQCWDAYTADVQRRWQRKELRPGETVEYDEATHRIEVGGSGAVMGVNGLITKVIFDHNPKNEFFVEESLPLDWMYPYLSPYGIIMKINRQPLSEMTEDMVRADHEFWSQYSSRLIGNWITYDTKVEEIVKWVEQVYQRRDFRSFTGDRKFVRDDQAQKSFSKLRCAIGGVYAWRADKSKPGTPEHQRMLKEADFALRQAFAFCPYNPEAVVRYVNLLLSPEVQRGEDALRIVRTCRRLDPFNAALGNIEQQIQDVQKLRAQRNPAQLEQALKANPDNFQAAFDLASVYLEQRQPERAVQTLDRVLNSPRADAGALHSLLQAYATLNRPDKLQETVNKLAVRFKATPTDLEAGIALAQGYRDLRQNDQANQILDGILNQPNLSAAIAFQLAQQYAAAANYPKLEITLEKLVKLSPDSPEAWYDLAAMKTILGKKPEALEDLREAFRLNALRRLQNPKALDLQTEIRTDSRFNSLRSLPEFQRLLSR